MSTLSQKSETVAEKCDCRRCLAVFCDSLTFLRQCGQGLTYANKTLKRLKTQLTREKSAVAMASW